MSPGAEPAPVVEVVREPQGAAGQPAALAVRVHHTAAGPRAVTLTVLGLDGGWAPTPARIASLAPLTAASVELVLTPPAGTVAAAYPFVVAAQSNDPVSGAVTSRAAVAESTLTVDRPGSVMVTVDPAEVRTARRRRVRLVLANSAPEPATVDLELRCSDGMRGAPRRTRVEVPARSTAVVRARVGPRRLRLAGEPTRFDYTVTARGQHAPAVARAVVAARPLIGPGAKRAVALAAVVAVWAAAAIVGLPRLVDQLERRDDPATSEALAEDGGGDGTGTGTESEPDAGTGGDDIGDEPDATATDPTRISGVVEAAAPDGVTVSIVPTTGFGEASDEEPADDADAVDPGRSTVTNDDGAWAFAGLGTSGHYLVTLSKAGFRTERRVVDAATAAEPLEVSLQAGDGQLSGRVTGPDGPVGGAELTLTDGTVTVTTSTSTTGEVGRWSVDGLSTPSTYLVTAVAEGLGAGSALLPLEAGGSAEQDLELRRGVATLTGQVTGRDATGRTRGLGGVTVTADDGETSRSATTITTSEEAGPLGVYTLPDLPIPGSYTVTVSGPGHLTQTRQLELTDRGQGLHRLDARLSRAGGEVQGLVTDADGEPLAAGLMLTDDEGTAYKVMSRAGEGAGGFRISGVAPGSYVLSAEVFGHVTGYARVEVAAARSSRRIWC